MTISIIGFGRFGKLIANLLSKHVDQIFISSKGLKSLDLKNTSFKFASLKQAASCDVVILAVPISEFEKVVKTIAPNLKRGSVLIDTCSVKVFPTTLMQKNVHKDVSILGTHPLWGPESVKVNNGLKNLGIVLCPVRISDILFHKISNQLKLVGLTVLQKTPAEHDEEVANSQALAQFVGRILEMMPLKNVDINTLGSEQLKILLKFVSHDTKQLFTDLQTFNPFSKAVRKRFMDIALLMSGDLIQNDKKMSVKK